MSKHDSVGKPKLRPGEIGYVGPGYPPEHGKIKAGQTKNPWGRGGKPRPDAPTNDFTAHMRRMLTQPVRSKDGQTYSHAEVLFNGLLKSVAAGDVRAARFYVELLEKYGPRSEAVGPTTNLAGDDKAILEWFEQELLARAGQERQETNGSVAGDVEESDDE